MSGVLIRGVKITDHTALHDLLHETEGVFAVFRESCLAREHALPPKVEALKNPRKCTLSNHALTLRLLDSGEAITEVALFPTK